MAQTVTTDSGYGRLTYAGLASLAFGLLDLIFLAMPFLVVGGSFASGYDIALGQYYHFGGTVQSLGTSYPVVWICASGGILAILSGIDAMFPGAGNRQPNYWKLVDMIGLSGLIVLVSSGVLLLQLCVGPHVSGIDFPAWGVGAEFAFGLGLITAAWSR